jgi:hypothetical protein
MSSTRRLSEKVAWDSERRAIELLDWETKQEDFDRLFEYIVTQLTKRNGVTRERLFRVVSEPDLRREVRAAAESFQENHISLPLFIYLHAAAVFHIAPSGAQTRGDRRYGS